MRNDGDVTKQHGVGFGDGWIIKIDENSNKIWQKTYGGSNPDGFIGIATRWDGSFL